MRLGSRVEQGDSQERGREGEGLAEHLVIKLLIRSCWGLVGYWLGAGELRSDRPSPRCTRKSRASSLSLAFDEPKPSSVVIKLISFVAAREENLLLRKHMVNGLWLLSFVSKETLSVLK